MLSFLIPGRRRFHGGGHGNPLQYSCLEKPHGQRSLATVHTVSKSQTWLKRHHSTAMLSLGFPGWLSNKESTCRTGEVGDSVSNSGSGRSPGGGHSNALNILTLRIPWTEGLVGYNPRGHKEWDTTEATAYVHAPTMLSLIGFIQNYWTAI